MGKKKRQKEQINIYASNKKTNENTDKVCVCKDSEPSSDGRLPPVRCRLCWVSSGWQRPERPAQCPGYICWCYQLTNRTPAGLGPCPCKQERRKREPERQKWVMKKGKDQKKKLGIIIKTQTHCRISIPPPLSLLASSSHWCSGHICQTVACRVSSLHREIKPGSKISFEAFDLSVAPASWAD